MTLAAMKGKNLVDPLQACGDSGEEVDASTLVSSQSFSQGI